jgi:hypothetical protein
MTTVKKNGGRFLLFYPYFTWVTMVIIINDFPSFPFSERIAKLAPDGDIVDSPASI